MRWVGFGDGCSKAFGGFGELGMVLEKEEWHCDGEDFIYSSRRCVKWEQRPACVKQRGGNVLGVSLFHLLDGSNFRMGGHGAMIGSRDVRNNGHLEQDMVTEALSLGVGQ